MTQKVPVRDRHRVVAVCNIWRIRQNSNAALEYLCLKRHERLRVYPGLWTVPGGGLEPNDYVNSPQTSPDGWENVLDEIALRREIKEEANVRVGKFSYLSNFAFIRPDGIPVIGIRFSAPYHSGTPRFDPIDATEIRWMSAEEVANERFLGNIQNEIARLDKQLRGIK